MRLVSPKKIKELNHSEKLTKAQKKSLTDLIIRLNTKIVFLQKQKSIQHTGGQSIGYKIKITKDLILKFLKKDCEHILDEIPSIKDYSLFDFRKRLCKEDTEQS